ncbi:hypothetical protein [Choristoneura rosaceana nucleopolyhedrovirus]|uniref:Uncharacterized protein n=1 Tax=Choristoneura rosaceana nucleopolyhedrovirus TaxID=58094 RepID=S5MR15_9ABAC|nr:hypothetical protein [Choristoneura rosaceana nucleopolyhedrovirus]AGR57073.1 hypothetical protein [Choristoneura rosaceana nucleopolyhedrovirus]
MKTQSVFIAPHLIMAASAINTVRKVRRLQCTMRFLLILFALVIAALADKALPDSLAPPPQHAGHFEGAPKMRTPYVYNADEQKLRECRSEHITWNT